MRRKLASLAAISMAVGLAACTKIESRDLIREGNAEYRLGHFEDAIDLYNQSLELEPDGVTVLWNRAMAAESIVLDLKDSTKEDEVATRQQYATLALDSLEEWNDKREKVGDQDDTPECAKIKADAEAAKEGEKKEGTEVDDDTDPDLAAYKEHRLAILGADARCDDLIEHWRQMHMACPRNEDLYMTIASTFEDICGKPEKAEEWYVKRTEDFPDSAKAWYALATRHFYPLMPDEGMEFNPAIDAKTRIEIADEVIDLLNKASALDRQYRDPFVWRSMAYTQRAFAREYVDPPESPIDSIEAISKRHDLMQAWREEMAVCKDIDKAPDCPLERDPGVLFRDLDVDGSSWKDREIRIFGNIDNDSVKPIDADEHIYEFTVVIEYFPAPPLPAEGEPPPPPPPPPAPDAEPLERTITVEYSFMLPAVEPGEEPPDISAEVAGKLENLKKQKFAALDGYIEGKGGELSMVATEKPPVYQCCREAPLTPEDEAADDARLKELRAELAALEAAEREAAEKAAEKGKKKKGRGR